MTRFDWFLKDKKTITSLTATSYPEWILTAKVIKKRYTSVDLAKGA